MTEPYQIPPNAVFDDRAIRQTLGVAPDVLARARRKGELRYSKKGARTFYLGQWVIDWLTREASPAASNEKEPAFQEATQ